MNLPRLSVRNPVAVNLLMWAVVAAGAWSWFHLTREFFPRTSSEKILITVPYPGATPEDVEKSVTRPIEREIENVEDVDRIEARVFEGLTLLTVELAEGADRTRVLEDLRAELDRVKPNLPDGAEEPEIAEARPRIPAIALVLHGTVPEGVLHDAVIRVRDDLLDLDEVSTVVIGGFRDREILIEILPERLETEGLTFEEVGRAVTRGNLDLPGGQLKGRTNIRVRTLGEEQRAHRIETLPIRARPDGSMILLRDVAVVREGFEDKVVRGSFRLGEGWRHRAGAGRAQEAGAGRAQEAGAGRAQEAVSPNEERPEAAERRAASLTVFKDPEQDAIEIADAVKAYARAHPTMAGGTIEVTVTTDIARFIEQRLDLLKRNARTGLLFVLLTLAVFLELRIAFWVMVGLLVSFAGTFLLMGIVGLTINFISLFGLIIVLGLIVDDAIVIGENIFTKLRAGVPPIEAAERGANEVAGPVVAAVLTTCVAFVPLAFIQGRIGSFLGVLPVVVICALSFSLFEAFLVLPSHLAHRLKKGRSRVALLYDRFNEAKHRLFERRLPALLESSLAVLLRWRYLTAALALASLVATAGLVAGGVVPFVLLQNTDAETATAKLEMASGTPEEDTLAVLERAERVAAEQPEVTTVFSTIGSSFSERGPEIAADPATVGQLVLELLPAEVREDRHLGTSIELLARLRRLTTGFPGVRRLSWAGRSGGPGGPDIEVLVRGDDLGTVGRAVAEVEDHLATYDGVDEIYDDLEVGKLEVKLSLRPGGTLLGLTTSDLATQVRHALFGIEAQDLQIGDEEVTVRAILPESARRTMADLSRLWIRTPNGRRVPLEEVARIRTGRGYASLARVDGKRAVTITADVDDAVANVGDVTRDLGRRLADLGARYPGVSYAFEGQKKETRESMGSLFFGFPFALLGIFSVIAVVFRSYTQPVIVMLVIPWGLAGAVLGHWLMGYPFTILSMIGAVALAGVVVNDGLILVDFANRVRRGGEGALEGILHAAKARLRPILLTSITTIAGLAPLMLERSFQAQFLIPMAISIVFGLAFATFLNLLLLPVFYLIFEDARMGVRWLFTGRYTDELLDGRRTPTAGPTS
ncbi:MAG: efflux RND transporter permease subunit [Planctomycetota bacterium]